MSEIFLKVLNMSISAGWIVIAVTALRLLLKRAPKWATVMLLGVVAIRLICPFSIESALSLIPSAQTVAPEIMTSDVPVVNTGIPIINESVNTVIMGSFTPNAGDSANPMQILIPILALVWVVGIAALTVYTAVSYLRVRRSVRTAVLFHDNIYQCEAVTSPFVLGIIKPKIYIPFNITEQDTEYIIEHEKSHIKRRDHLWKPIGFLLLTVHWFNPLMWLAYILLCRDIELACDERVIKELGYDGRADYSQTLLNFSVDRRTVSACPLAFGEVGVKKRVKGVLNYKKPAIWAIVLAVIAIAVTAVCLLTDPKSDGTVKLENDLDVFLDAQISEKYRSEHSTDNFIAVSKSILSVVENRNETLVYAWVLCQECTFENGAVKVESSSHIPTAITVKKTDGGYELIEYWIPRDGNLYADDIKGKFPPELWDAALDSQRYISDQKSFCLKKALEHFNEAEQKNSEEKNKIFTVTFETGNEVLPEHTPSLMLLYGQAKYEAMKGTFNWAVPGKDGIINATTADCLPPFDLESKKYMPKLEYITSEEVSEGDLKKVYLQFDALPTEVTARGWDNDAWGNYDDAKGKPVAMMAYYSGTDNPQIVLYLEEDIEIYEIIASWDRDNNAGGSVCYSFYTQN